MSVDGLSSAEVFNKADSVALIEVSAVDAFLPTFNAIVKSEIYIFFLYMHV